ncbi:GTP-binding protein ERG [Magnolia sinica]|uniref:GTP-binding protein ERG n=1 Tax=Magnolia sinica TaxID=86752 RepID=UPI00265AAC91|nr:GTP-binding protein ERG [Magnolia sinica]
MQAWKALKPLFSSSLLSSSSFCSSSRTRLIPTLSLLHFFSAQPHQSLPTPTSPEEAEDSDSASVFDSSHFSIPLTPAAKPTPTWNEAYRAKVDRTLFGIDTTQQQQQQEKEKKKKKKKKDKNSAVSLEEDGEGENRRANRLAKALLQVALEKPDDVEEEESGMIVKEEDQRSLSVGIIGAPNAGKSCLTNFMVGTKVAAVSRKTNTTTHEVLGVMTKGNTQICFFDTPGLMLKRGGHPYRTDVKVRVESAWSSVNLYDVLIVIFDVHRHITMPDSRVIRLIKHLGSDEQPKQKRVLCMNKVDLVEVKKDLLKVAEEFGGLPGYERYFMISGLKGSGVKDLTEYLMEQALKRPWDEDPTILNEDIMKNISLEVVREKMLHHIHQEIPYTTEHRLMDWKELRDGSLRVEQHFITQKLTQRKILVGKNGSKIGRIGLEANEELRSIFKRDVHLILQVRVA